MLCFYNVGDSLFIIMLKAEDVQDASLATKGVYSFALTLGCPI